MDRLEGDLPTGSFGCCLHRPAERGSDGIGAAAADAGRGSGPIRAGDLPGQLRGLSWRKRPGCAQLADAGAGWFVPAAPARRQRPHLASLRPGLVRVDLPWNERPAAAWFAAAY